MSPPNPMITRTRFDSDGAVPEATGRAWALHGDTCGRPTCTRKHGCPECQIFRCEACDRLFSWGYGASSGGPLRCRPCAAGLPNPGTVPQRLWEPPEPMYRESRVDRTELRLQKLETEVELLHNRSEAERRGDLLRIYKLSKLTMAIVVVANLFAIGWRLWK